MRKESILWWVRGGVVGLSPLFPGTIASVVAACFWPLWLCLPHGLLWSLWFLLAIFSCWACNKVMKEELSDDPSWIVIDEMLAVWLIPVAYNGLWDMSWYMAWLLFRALDITKPWPINWVEKLRPKFLGIMLDDLVAVFLAIILVKFWF